jgi:UDP-N-acetylmuramoyl-tripeptide--D-alanyl-D-alanine ligase
MAVFRWTDDEVRQALGLSSAALPTSGEFEGVSTDSRTVGEGDLFVALQGPNFDGHDFVDRALEKGAAGAVVQHDPGVHGSLYVVEDTLEALGALARHRRRRLDASVVAVTGSSGKTSTKELLRAALGGARRVHATHGNLNNLIGLPKTILSAPDDTEVLVLEMGTNGPGEIAALTAIAEPEVAIVTTVSEAHLEGLGTLEGVLEEKLDLVRGTSATGPVFVGSDSPLLVEHARRERGDVRVAGFGPEADESLRPSDPEVRPDGCWRFIWRGQPVQLRIPGRHSVVNALLALSVTEVLGVGIDLAAKGVSAVQPTSLRGEIRQVGGLTLLLDCYNANPQSTRAALEWLRAVGREDRRTVALLGTMLELGDATEALHTSVLHDALDSGADLVVATGAFAAVALSEGITRPGLLIQADPERAYDELDKRLHGDEVVLLKGSRGVALERLVPYFEADQGEGR